MQNASFRRIVLLALLLTVLAAPWASAADRAADASASPLDFLGRFWDFLKSTWSETGCRLDPDGRCAPAPQPQADEGCRLDPNGGCGA